MKRYISLYVVLLITFSLLAFSQNKENAKPVYEKRYKTEMQGIEAEAKELDSKQAEAEKFIQQIRDRRLILQGQYSVYMANKDSVLVKTDSTKAK